MSDVDCSPRFLRVTIRHTDPTSHGSSSNGRPRWGVSRSCLGMLLIAACGPSTAPPMAPPPVLPTLVLGAGVHARDLPLAVWVDVPAGTPSHVRFDLLVSTTGATSPPACLQSGPCTDLESAWRVGSFRNGSGRKEWAVPALPAADVWLQLVASNPNTGRDHRSAVEHRVFEDVVDLDGDGVSNLDELALGTDPQAPDSDGGGSWDGQERHDGTDPLDPGDDLGMGEWRCADGGDDDGDGLVDCEDGDCMSACTELCTGGQDDDGDGLIDCLDDDCWGPDCNLEVRIVGGAGGISIDSPHDYDCSNFPVTVDFRGQPVVGEIRGVDADGEAATCEWQAGVYMMDSFQRNSYSVSGRPGLSRLSFAGGCEAFQPLLTSSQGLLQHMTGIAGGGRLALAFAGVRGSVQASGFSFAGRPPIRACRDRSYTDIFVSTSTHATFYGGFYGYYRPGTVVRTFLSSDVPLYHTVYALSGGWGPLVP